MSDIYDILEYCLQEIEKGADIEIILARYPQHADELRPILETSIKAIQLASPGPSPEVERRGRAKVLQYAAQMRETQVQSSRRAWSVPLRRALVSLTVIGVLFISSTRLVQASSTTLPGDNLYPVKRTWEDVRVLFTFNMQAREALEIEHENERLKELDDLFAEGRSAPVDFAGTVMSQNGDLWDVSKVPVLISPQTDLGAQSPVIGDAVRVRGYTQSGGTVMAERVDLLPAGMPLPEVEDDLAPSHEQETPEAEHPENSGEGSSGKEAEDGTSKQGATQSPQVESKPREFSRSGMIDSFDGNTMVVNGQSMNVSGAEIDGTPKVGANIKVEGYFDANGVFVVTKIEIESSGSGSGDSISGNDNKDGDSNENNNDNGSHEDDGGGGHDDNNNGSSSGNENDS